MKNVLALLVGLLAAAATSVLAVLSLSAQSTPVPGGGGGAGGGAPTGATYVVSAANSSLPNALVLSGRPVVFGTGTASILNPQTMLFVHEEFLSGNNVSVNVGSLGWTVANGTVTLQASEAGHPGILRRETGNTQNTIVYTHTRATATTGVVSPGDFFDVLWIVRLNVVDANTQIRLGLANSATADPANDGIYFEKLGTDSNWFGVSRITSSTGRIVTGTAVDTNWVRLRIWRSDASTVSYSINGGTAVTTASVTNVMLQPFTSLKTLAANENKTLDHDYFDLVVGTLTR